MVCEGDLSRLPEGRTKGSCAAPEAACRCPAQGAMHAGRGIPRGGTLYPVTLALATTDRSRDASPGPRGAVWARECLTLRPPLWVTAPHTARKAAEYYVHTETERQKEGSGRRVTGKNPWGGARRSPRPRAAQPSPAQRAPSGRGRESLFPQGRRAVWWEPSAPPKPVSGSRPCPPPRPQPQGTPQRPPGRQGCRAGGPGQRV